ncbi:unnamed protein product [Calicophoron daubneyi]
MLRQWVQKLPRMSIVVVRCSGTHSESPSESDQQAVTDKLTKLFKKAAEFIDAERREAELTNLQTVAPETHSSNSVGHTKQGDGATVKGDRPPSTAVSFVPFTMGRLLHQMNIHSFTSKRGPSDEQSFATLLRSSPFVQLGNFDGREVLGVVIENVNDTDLYIDFGGKFHCVCPQPTGQHYPRGSLVRIRLHDPEMTNQFMINTKAISLCEADATLLGPYRGRLTRTKTEEATTPVEAEDTWGTVRPATEDDSVSVENWKLF